MNELRTGVEWADDPVCRRAVAAEAMTADASLKRYARGMRIRALTRARIEQVLVRLGWSLVPEQRGSDARP